MRIWMRRFFFPSHYHVCVHNAHVEITFNWAMRVFMLWSNAAERRVYFARWGCEAPGIRAKSNANHYKSSCIPLSFTPCKLTWSPPFPRIWFCNDDIDPRSVEPTCPVCLKSIGWPIIDRSMRGLLRCSCSCSATQENNWNQNSPAISTDFWIDSPLPADRAAIRLETWREKGELSNETAWRLRSGKKIRPLCCYWSGNCCRKRRFCSYFSMDGDAATSKQIYTSLKSVSKIWITC